MISRRLFENKYGNFSCKKLEGEAEEVWELWVEIQARETLHMAELAKGEWEERGREGKVLSLGDRLALGGCQRKERKSRSS